MKIYLAFMELRHDEPVFIVTNILYIEIYTRNPKYTHTSHRTRLETTANKIPTKIHHRMSTGVLLKFSFTSSGVLRIPARGPGLFAGTIASWAVGPSSDAVAISSTRETTVCASESDSMDATRDMPMSPAATASSLSRVSGVETVGVSEMMARTASETTSSTFIAVSEAS
ncbi:hypothetical protein B0H19DRAFT_1095911 [Mycena capillaripes]|nr:hypothetical protein B0H19DRAFT_1095911 [Mycena capillaripes]